MCESSEPADIKAGFDVVNALTMSDNNMFLNEQKVSTEPTSAYVLISDYSSDRATVSWYVLRIAVWLS